MQIHGNDTQNHCFCVCSAGDGDWQALQRAVSANTYVMGGSRGKSDHVKAELKMLAQLGRDILVLTDPDEFGRELRLLVDDLIGKLRT